MTQRWTISGEQITCLYSYQPVLRLTPLHHLAMRGNLTMVNLLLDRQRLIPIWKPNEGSYGSVDATDIQVRPFLIKTADQPKCV